MCQKSCFEGIYLERKQVQKKQLTSNVLVDCRYIIIIKKNWIRSTSNLHAGLLRFGLASGIHGLWGGGEAVTEKKNKHKITFKCHCWSYDVTLQSSRMGKTLVAPNSDLGGVFV